MVKIIEGNLLEADVDIICHQVNCKGVMGAGLAKQIKTLYPEVYTEYYNLCKENNPEKLLGVCQQVSCHNGRYVANLFGQLGYGKNKIQTDYKALEQALSIVAQRAIQYEESVGIPYLLGCGLAGGDWNIVYEIINRLFKDYDKVTIYKLV